MRLLILLPASLALIGVVTPLSAADQFGQLASQGTASRYAAPACAAPEYGAEALQPGCCQCRSDCCDDVWAGYCQEKKNGHGFAIPCLPGMGCWSRPGMIPWPGRPCSSCATSTPDTVCSACNVRGELAQPAAKAAPMPPATAQRAPAPKRKPKPKPLPPAPEEPKKRKPREKKTVEADPAYAPLFNPAAWTIGSPDR